MLKRSSWKWVILSFMVLLTLMIAANAQSQPPSKVIKWQFALSATVIGSRYQFYQEVEIPRRVKEATRGALEIIPHKELVKAADILDAVRDRRVDMGNQGSNHRGDMPLLNYLSLPAILPYEALPKMHTKLEPIFQEVLRSQYGVEMLGFGYWPRQLLISKRPAASFEELKGLKFRTHAYELLQLMREAGGAPVSMPYGEVYLALQRGAIDGAVSSLAGFKGPTWYEVAKYVNWWPLGNTAYFFIVNKDSWNMLPANMQKIVRETVSKAGFETWHASDLDDKEMKDEFIKTYGCTHLYPPEAEVKQLEKMMGPVLEDWKKRSGPRSSEVIAIINEVLGTKY